MTPEQQLLRDQALDWLVKTGDPRFDGWDAFTAWLEQSPGHADAYHALAGDVADMDQWLVDAQPSVQPLTAPMRHVGPIRWAIAASVAVLAAAGAILLSPALTSDRYTTAAGEIRTIALGNGDQLILNGDTKVEMSGLDRRDISLEQGQLLLKMTSGDHVEVTSGDLRFVDVGTIFEVARESAKTRLLVSEGLVLVDPKGAKVKVAAGQMLEAADGAPTLKPAPAADAEAGGWTTGQLAYFDASVAQVATDLRRSTGLAFSPTGATGQRRFSGTLSIDHVRRDPASLGPLLGVRVSKAGNEWELKEGG